MMRLHQSEVQEFILGKLVKRNGSSIGHIGNKSPSGMVV